MIVGVFFSDVDSLSVEETVLIIRQRVQYR